MMRAIPAMALGFLAVFAASPAFAQSAQTFTGSICEIDTTPLKVPSYTTPDGTKSIYTFNSTKLCTGVASKRNIKLTCTGTLPNWNRPDKQVKNFVCTINGDQCGITPKVSDPNKPYLTATQSMLQVTGGVATLTCYWKPG